ncbi:MAG: deoxyguanosinetriphosphate triphosphohydrolase [Firmicutes bacterium]|nr:deoxyguanosinetriphosphate triphosphohydrolase [Bacillota bacterium]
MTIREELEQREQTVLKDPRSWSINSRGREREEEESDMRTCYMRDRDRILHCKSFRRMKHKTQVFLAPEGDHYRTRLTHTLEVSQIARTIARVLRLNEDLVEAIALGHDLGHTPFGHAGERVLARKSPYGFTHEAQSVRVVSRIENGGLGLNLTYEVRDGIANHSMSAMPSTEEGKIVRLADKIAYINHDIDDAVRAHIISEDDLPIEPRKVLGFSFRERINGLVHNVIEASSRDGSVGMSQEYLQAMMELRAAMYRSVYVGSEAKKEEKKAEDMIAALYDEFMSDPERYLIPLLKERLLSGEEKPEILVCDHIASMSDNYAMQLFTDLFIPKRWTVM